MCHTKRIERFGRGLAASLMLGAAGALLGTRFLATVEAPIPDAVKQKLAQKAPA